MSGDIIKVKNREYQVLEILPRKHREHDLILCLDLRNKTRECFQRFDVEENYTKVETPYPQEYKDIAIAEHHKGTKNIEIARILYNRHDNVRPLNTLSAFVSRITSRGKNK